MATLAIFNRIFPVSASRTGFRESAADARDERFRVRRVPNEQIFFYTKPIDNSRVVRERDPKTRGNQWRLMVATLGGAALLITVFLPGAYSFITGHELQDLKQKREQLLAERRRLDVEEAKLLSPARLEQWAEKQRLSDPGNKVFFLPGDKNGTEASLRSGHTR